MSELRFAVLGLSRLALLGDEVGVGKSSLCSRFVRPGEDDYRRFGEDHGALVSMADFHDTELNRDQFLYFGKAHRAYNPPGSKHPTSLTVDVVEHTEFVDDGSCRSFCTPLTKPYHLRASAVKLHSPGKTSYLSLGSIGARSGGHGSCPGREPFPVEFNTRGVDGFVFALDPTSTSEVRYQQMKLLDMCLASLPRSKPLVVALTKCDQLSSLALDRMSGATFDLVQFFMSSSSTGKGLKRSYKGKEVAVRQVLGKMELKREKRSIPYFFVSARESVGVDAPFLHLAHAVLRLPGPAPRPGCYSALLEQRAILEAQLSAAARSLMRRYIVDEHSKLMWKENMQRLDEIEDFRKFEEVFGNAAAKELFTVRLMEISRNVDRPMYSSDLALHTGRPARKSSFEGDHCPGFILEQESEKSASDCRGTGKQSPGPGVFSNRHTACLQDGSDRSGCGKAVQPDKSVEESSPAGYLVPISVGADVRVPANRDHSLHNRLELNTEQSTSRQELLADVEKSAPMTCIPLTFRPYSSQPNSGRSSPLSRSPLRASLKLARCFTNPAGFPDGEVSLIEDRIPYGVKHSDIASRNHSASATSTTEKRGGGAAKNGTCSPPRKLSTDRGYHSSDDRAWPWKQCTPPSVISGRGHQKSNVGKWQAVSGWNLQRTYL